MMNKEAMKLVLDSLIYASSYCDTYDAITVLREALAEQPAQQEPVGTYGEIFESMRSLLQSGRQADQQIYMAMQHKPLYTSPPAQPAPTVQEWMKPHPKCDEGCLFQCTKGFTQFAECATTPPAAQPAPVQEPVGWWDAKIGFFEEKHFDQLQPLYTNPQPQREWVGLTEQERHEIMKLNYARTEWLVHATEAKLKEKNT